MKTILACILPALFAGIALGWMFRGGEEKTELPPGGQESKSPARSTAAAREGVANPAGRAPKSRIRPLEKPEGQKPDPAAKAMAEA